MTWHMFLNILALAAAAAIILIVNLFAIIRIKKISQSSKDSLYKFHLISGICLGVVLVCIINLNFESVKSFETDGDAPGLIIDILAIAVSVFIAFYQFRIEKSLRAAEAIEAEANKKRHKSELVSERFRSVDGLSKCVAYAQNFCLPECRCMSETSDGKYCITVSGGDPDAFCFYKPYFEIDKNEKNLVCKINENELEINECINTYNKLRFIICDNSADVKSFFCYPAQLFGSSARARLSISRHFSVTDKSISYGDNEAVGFEYIINFDLVPTSGYKKDGSFELEISDIKMNICDGEI